ncbi:uncharacterized protein [Anabrus simplex]|uniref:uncharacterized protein isoform X5 n=1 Tax=Anabrus simplex TaxID=316456 RepID=UPI0035A29802
MGILSRTMDEPVFVKSEPAWSLEAEEPSNFEDSQLVSEMIPVKQEIKLELTEPGPTQQNAFEENSQVATEMIPVKQETKSELTEPGLTQENAFEPSADIKEEFFVEHQLAPNIKEENKVFSP